MRDLPEEVIVNPDIMKDQKMPQREKLGSGGQTKNVKMTKSQNKPSRGTATIEFYISKEMNAKEMSNNGIY